MKDTTINSLGQMVRDIGIWLGLDLSSLFDDMFTGQRGTVDVADITNAINQMVNEAKNKGENYMTKLESELNKIYSIPAIGGNIKNVVANAQKQLNDKILNARTIISNAESKLNSATDKANEILNLSRTQRARTNSKFRSGSPAENIEQSAIKYAQQAKQLYNQLGEMKLS